MSPINQLWILSMLAIILVTILHMGYGAPRTIRDDSGMDSLDPPVDTVLDDSRPFRTVIQTIIDMIKRMFGWDERTSFVREDGTVEYVDNGGHSNSFLSRIGRRIMSFINTLLNLFLGDSGSIPSFDLNTARSSILSELDKEGIHLNNG